MITGHYTPFSASPVMHFISSKTKLSTSDPYTTSKSTRNIYTRIFPVRLFSLTTRTAVLDVHDVRVRRRRIPSSDAGRRVRNGCTASGRVYGRRTCRRHLPSRTSTTPRRPTRRRILLISRPALAAVEIWTSKLPVTGGEFAPLQCFVTVGWTTGVTASDP